MQEKAFVQYSDLYIILTDFEKAFDTVDREPLWNMLTAFGCPEPLDDMIRLIHDGGEGRVAVAGKETERLNITHGMKRGCVLAPTLFLLFLTVVLLRTSTKIDNRFHITTGSDGKLFDLVRLRTKTREKKELVTELPFADDTALVGHNEA